MTVFLSNARGRWFLDVYPGIVTSNLSFRCSEPSCSFSAFLKKDESGPNVAYTVERIVFPQHCHCMKTLRRRKTKSIIQRDLTVVENGLDDDGVLQEKHRQWQEEARQEGAALKKRLMDEAATIQ